MKIAIAVCLALAACSSAPDTTKPAPEPVAATSNGLWGRWVLKELKECWKPTVENPDKCVIERGITL